MSIRTATPFGYHSMNRRFESIDCGCRADMPILHNRTTVVGGSLDVALFSGISLSKRLFGAIASLKRPSRLIRAAFQSQQGQTLCCWLRTTSQGNPFCLSDVTPILMIALICHYGFAIILCYVNNALMCTHCLASTDEDNGGVCQCMFSCLPFPRFVSYLALYYWYYPIGTVLSSA
jgi:hypothetical protein